MKANKLFLLALLSLSLSACSVIPTNRNNGGNNNNNPTPDNGDNNNNNGNNNNNNNNGNQEDPVVTPVEGYDHTESFGGSGSSSATTKMQDTPILHCWNWSMTNIANNLSNIKEAGFKTIQLSPMQPQKDYYTGQNWSSQWWKLYQPLGFKIAGNNENVLGNKDDLTNLCKKAKNAGIDVIVDVVSNHLAGGSKTSLNQAVRSFEADIYNNNLIHSYGDWAKDTNLQSIVQGNIGDYPDLKTETTTVQNRVLSLLKEYIDCGVNGFRFDAAKHIETPDDGTYASQYWPTILDGVATYADSVGKEKPYCYGEILTTCGNGRSYSSYTKYMSVIDNSQGTKILNAVIDKNLTKVSDETYNSKVNPNKLVLWAESHDTYANDEKETTRVSIENINKTYLIQTSRKDASTLYFARPANAMMGDIGDTSYKNSEIKAINEFHNQFVGHSENISTSDGCFVNERGNDGVYILPISNSSNSATIDVNNLNNGTYVDLITKKEFQVNNKKVSVNFSNNYGVILVNKNGVTPINQSGNLPKVTISYNDVNNSSSKILVSKQNCDLLTYQINNGNINILSGNELSLNNEKDGLLKINFIASNNQGKVNYTINIIKTTSLYNKSLIIYNIDSTQTYLGWLWKNNGEGKWCDFIKEGEIMGLDIGDNNKFIIVTFPSGTTSSNASWDNKISQSNDITYSQRLYDFINL